MSRENALWGTERIRGELLKLGIAVSNRSIRRYRWRGPSRQRSQNWRTFLGYPAVTYREQEKDRGLYPVQAGPSPTLGWISHPVLPGDTPARTFTHIPGGLALAFGPSATGTPSPVPILELLLNC